jgi:hypothetical protein
MRQRPKVRLRYLNFFPGFDDDRLRKDVLMELCDEYEFILTGEPDVLLVGCYGQDAVTETRAIKVGYYTENIAPDLEHFDYFFGCEYTEVVNSPKYCKRVFGTDGIGLLAPCADPEQALAAKTRFCNFIYSARVPFRERFYTELSRYREIVSPGRAMNNSSDLADQSGPGKWRAGKKSYLGAFKFTIAFENSRRIGYATEKLFDALWADTIPIYWGDPKIDTILNRDALVFVDADWEGDVLPWLRLPEARVPYRPYYRRPNLLNRLAGRVNDEFHRLRARIPYMKGFREAIEEVKHLDNDRGAYLDKLGQPRMTPRAKEIRAEYLAFWRGIIERARVARAEAT